MADIIVLAGPELRVDDVIYPKLRAHHARVLFLLNLCQVAQFFDLVTTLQVAIAHSVIGECQYLVLVETVAMRFCGNVTIGLIGIRWEGIIALRSRIIIMWKPTSAVVTTAIYNIASRQKKPTARN